MALTIAVASLKGGVGKSTVTLNVAACLHRAGHRALIVDADSQGTCRAWAAVAAGAGHDGPPVVALEGAALRRDLARVASGFDVVVIDAPPRLGPETRAAMLAADVVLMPITPGAADVWALRETLAVLDDARSMRPELVAAVVLNRADRTTLAKLAREAAAGLGVGVLEAPLRARVAFGEATLAGQGVVDYAPGSPAATEVEALTAAVLAVVRGTTNEQDDEGQQARGGLRPSETSAPDERSGDRGGGVRSRSAAKPERSGAGAATARVGRKPTVAAPVVAKAGARASAAGEDSKPGRPKGVAPSPRRVGRKGGGLHPAAARRRRPRPLRARAPQPVRRHHRGAHAVDEALATKG